MVSTSGRNCGVLSMKTEIVDLKRTKAEIKEEKEKYVAQPSIEPSVEKYPWSTKMDLDEYMIDKLDIDLSEIEMGATVKIAAYAKVVGISQNERTDGKNGRLELQITKMQISDEESFESAFNKE